VFFSLVAIKVAIDETYGFGDKISRIYNSSLLQVAMPHLIASFQAS
jgi:hypothetical protein